MLQLRLNLYLSSKYGYGTFYSIPYRRSPNEVVLFHIGDIKKRKREGGRDRTPREGQALRWRSSSQDVTGCWLEDAQEGLGRPTKTALQLQGVVFQAPASPLAAAQRVLACTGPRPERQGSKARSFIYSGCCWGLGISCLGEEGKKQVSLSVSSWGLLRKIALSSTVVHTLVSAIALVSVYSMCTRMSAHLYVCCWEWVCSVCALRLSGVYITECV